MTDLQQITAGPEERLQKHCPVCKRANDTEARICTCGYWFDQSILLQQASNLPNIKKRALKKKSAKVLILTGFIASILAAVAIWTGAIDVSKNSEDEKGLKSDQPSGQRAILVDKKAPAALLEGTVTGVYSGDTITIRDLRNEEHSVRLAGISAPESGQPSADLARSDLVTLIMDKKVTIVLQKFDVNDLAGKVLLDGKNINSELLRAGLAWHNQYSVLQTDEDRQLYNDAEAFAKGSKVGVWSDPNAVPPWESRPATDMALTDKHVTDAPLNSPEKTASGKTVAPGGPKEEGASEKSSGVRVKDSPATQAATTAPEAAIPKLEVEKPRPANPTPTVSERRPGATARCNDGSYSYRVTRTGSCAGNAGVAEWLQVEKPPVKTDPAGKKYTLGPRGGCFYLNAGGSKVYVDKSLCAQ